MAKGLGFGFGGALAGLVLCNGRQAATSFFPSFADRGSEKGDGFGMIADMSLRRQKVPDDLCIPGKFTYSLSESFS